MITTNDTLHIAARRHRGAALRRLTRDAIGALARWRRATAARRGNDTGPLPAAVDEDLEAWVRATAARNGFSDHGMEDDRA